ncbi:MAG TPA: hypothetical protein VIP11_10060, partial [Gemmatimonadaceae bacterium]
MRNSILATAASCLLATASAAAQQASTSSLYDQAANDWARGNYPSALQKLITVVSAPDGGPYLERTALLTGELFRTTELSTDGRAVRWAPSGNFASYEVGTGRTRATRIIDTHGAPRQIAEVKGYNLVVAPGDQHAAYTAVREGAEADTVVMIRDLATQQERPLADGGLRRASVIWLDAKTLIVAGAQSADARKTDLFSVSIDGGAATPLTTDDSVKTDPVVAPGGRFVVFTAGGASPIARG